MTTPTPTPPPEPPLYLVTASGIVAYFGDDHTAAEVACQGSPDATMYLCAATQRHIHGTWTSTAAFHIEQQWRNTCDERDHARDLLQYAMRVITEAAFRARDRGDRAEADELCAEVASLRRG